MNLTESALRMAGTDGADECRLYAAALAIEEIIL